MVLPIKRGITRLLIVFLTLSPFKNGIVRKRFLESIYRHLVGLSERGNVDKTIV